jgi:ATPase family associated with various cellular activities (AAA)
VRPDARTVADLASAELRLRLSAILRGIRAAVARRDTRIRALARPELADLAITAQHAGVVLAEVERFVCGEREFGPGASYTAAEVDRLAKLRRRAAELDCSLPLQMLAKRGLSELDRDLLLLVAAPALEPAFGTLYGYLNDLRSCTTFTASIGVDVLAADVGHGQRVLAACGPFAPLRADGWVTAAAVDGSPATLLRPADGVVELLTGAPVDAGLLGRDTQPCPSGASDATIRHAAAVAAAFQQGGIDVVGLWGPAASGRTAVIATLAAGRPVVAADGIAAAGDVERALQRAALADAICVLAVPRDRGDVSALVDRVARSRVPVVLVGTDPVRAPELIRRRNFAEVALEHPGFAERRSSWSAAFPGLDASGVDDLAGRFRLLPEEIEAVARMDAACATWAPNGDRPNVDTLAGLVSRRRSPGLAAVRTPRRGPELLVLPPAERAQVFEVAAAARAWPRVADAWRLDRFGNPGVVALFTGEPGTGKTLAAEVIAAEIGLPLMEVDLSRLVSKWLGETEKHLDAVFTEAEASNCVLFFDEADSLFGQRGEVSRGSDRYANLEVGYLLQRLERFEGLAILASNLRGNLDPAFTRRFHHVVHFPRPAEAERRRLWEITLGPPVELAEPIDIDILAGLDLTGAGIAAVIRSAGLAAARPDPAALGRPAPLTAADVVAAARRQFQREARLLPREQLGAYARLL